MLVAGLLTVETDIELVWQEFRCEMDKLWWDIRAALVDLLAAVQETLQQELQALGGGPIQHVPAGPLEPPAGQVACEAENRLKMYYPKPMGKTPAGGVRGNGVSPGGLGVTKSRECARLYAEM
ncbi:UNVERIFIED_CONTAM: hypothetical protein K2H54_033505 [Gekko kuhli]